MRRGRQSHQVQRGPQCRRGPGWWRTQAHVAGLEVCVLARWVWDTVGGGLGRKRGRWRKLERNGHGWFLCLQQASTRCPRAWQVTGVTRAWPNQPAASTSAGIPLARRVPNRSWTLAQPVPPPRRVGAAAPSLWRGRPGRGRSARTRASRAPVDRAAQGLGAGPGSPRGARGRGGGWGRLRSTGLSGGLDLGPPRAARGGSGPRCPLP